MYWNYMYWKIVYWKNRSLSNLKHANKIKWIIVKSKWEIKKFVFVMTIVITQNNRRFKDKVFEIILLTRCDGCI